MLWARFFFASWATPGSAPERRGWLSEGGFGNLLKFVTSSRRPPYLAAGLTVPPAAWRPQKKQSRGQGDGRQENADDLTTPAPAAMFGTLVSHFETGDRRSGNPSNSRSISPAAQPPPEMD
ncbi:unnamed protein product [Amoebophrya sp. A120]|nr:unnamed protein product [Amoebophrya sp. A120]|eukprot:GSA120T00015382001.1